VIVLSILILNNLLLWGGNDLQHTIEPFLKYLKTTHPLRMVWHMIWLFCILCILSVSYIITFHFTPVLDLWQQSRSMNHFRVELATTLAVDQHINQELQRLLDQTGAHRSYLFRYHNGIATVSGTPFMFHTNTHEMIKPGVARLIAYNQRLPTSINTTMNTEFARRNCVVMTNLERQVESISYWYFQTRGAHSMIRCAVYSAQGDILGFVGVDYVERTAIDQVRSKEKDVQENAAAISRILDRNSR
jgi:hypothetical protein